MKKKKIVIQAVKAARKRSREEEIEQYGKPINHNKIVPSKKIYNRKKSNANQKNDLHF